MSLATYGTPGSTAPLIFRGYTSAANDGGIGGISGAGSFAIYSGAAGNIIFSDLHLHNTGSAAILTPGVNAVVENCEINNSSGNGVVMGNRAIITRCKLHDIGGVGIVLATGAFCYANFLKNGTKDFTTAIQVETASIVSFNILSLDGSTVGILLNADGATALNNSIYSNAGTGTGVSVANSRLSIVALNNIIEGFSGTGGKGVNINASGQIYLYGNNKFYNNATHESFAGDIYLNLGNNDTLGASPFTNPAGDDFSVSTAVKAGAYPSSFRGSSTNQYLDVGAAQRQEPAGGGGSGRRSRIRGHGI